MATQYENVSPDLIWEIVNGKGSQLVKTRKAGGHSFSRDPYNLLNKHSRKHEGFVNEKAVSIQQPHPNSTQPNGLIFTTKTPGKSSKPASSAHVTTFGASTSTRKSYKVIARALSKRGYRSDLRSYAVARASAIKLSQKPKKDAKPTKLRGKAAKKAEAEA